MFSIVRTLWDVFLHSFQRRVTRQYPEQPAYLPPRWRGRIILSRDPDGGERLCRRARLGGRVELDGLDQGIPGRQVHFI